MAQKPRSERNCSGFFLWRGIIKRCTPLGSKCTPHRPFVKWYRGVKRKRLHGDHFRTTVEPVIVKRYRKTLANRGFCKKKLDTRFDTHCIKTGVQLWQGYKDSNLGHAVLETADKILYNPHEYYIFGQDDSCVLQFVLQFLKMLFNYIFLLFAIWFVWNCHS